MKNIILLIGIGGLLLMTGCDNKEKTSDTTEYTTLSAMEVKCQNFCEKTNKRIAEKMKITYPLSLDPNADIFGLFALKKAGVTRNIILDRNGKIVLRTRLFNKEEFNHMKKVIKELIES